MENDCRKGNQNIYFACRKEAAKSNDRLSSRDAAAELLGISPSTLANHELGITKNVPVDTVVMMADLYRCPELRNHYCKNECPIGKMLPLATEFDDLQAITVRLLNRLDQDELESMRRSLLKIAEDNIVSKEELERMSEIVGTIRKLQEVSTELTMYYEKYGGEV